MFDYVRDPREIYRRSFDAISARTDLSGVPGAMAPLVLRLIHASAMPEIVKDLWYSIDAMTAGRQALKDGAPVLVDSSMVAAGIIGSRLPAENQVVCTLDRVDPATVVNDTRSARAVELWRDRLEGSVVAIGNAPTALFRLLEMLADGARPPAFIAGFPVGFVGAAESKQALIEHAGSIPYVTLKGRLGGSALAAAAVNSLVEENE